MHVLFPGEERRLLLSLFFFVLEEVDITVLLNNLFRHFENEKSVVHLKFQVVYKHFKLWLPIF